MVSDYSLFTIENLPSLYKTNLKKKIIIVKHVLSRIQFDKTMSNYRSSTIYRVVQHLFNSSLFLFYQVTFDICIYKKSNNNNK